MTDKPDPRAHKYAILHLFAGMLLILKERLSREHPALIFTKVEKQGSPDAHTVDFNSAVERLKANAGVAFSERDEKMLRDAQALRNDLEHYHLELPLKKAQELIGRMAEFLYEFMKKELSVDLHDELPKDAWFRLRDLSRIAAAIEREREEDWLRRAASYAELPEDELRELFDDSSYHPKHNPEPQEHFCCESCGEETVVTSMGEGDIGVCTNPQCRETYHVTHCARCGIELLCNRVDAWVLCDNCHSYIQEQ